MNDKILKLQREVALLQEKEKIRKQELRLCEMITKRITTSFIFALSEMESNLGFLWGHGKDEDNLTENEQEYRQIYNDIRKRILDNGNNQIRLVKLLMDNKEGI